MLSKLKHLRLIDRAFYTLTSDPLSLLCLVASAFLTRYSHAIGVYGTIVVCLSVSLSVFRLSRIYCG